MEIEFSRLVDALPALVWTVHSDGRSTFVNRRWCEYTGLGCDEAVGHGWQAAIHPADVTEFLQELATIARSNAPGEIDARLRRFDGEHRWFTFRFAPLPDEAKGIASWCGTATYSDERGTETKGADARNLRLQRFVGALRDVTASRQSEAELRQANTYLTIAQRLSKTGSFMWDLDANESLWSAEMYRIFEIDPGSVVPSGFAREVVHPDDIPIISALMPRVREGEDFDVEFRLLTRHGAVKNVHVVGHVFDPTRERLVFVGAVQDVTELKRGEEALNKARAELAHVARVTTLSALTAPIAHEVSQPLSGILTNANTCLRMLAADPPNLEGARETARRTIRDTNRATEVIKRLRAFFFRKAPTIEPVDLNDATREVIALSSSELQRSRVVLQTDFSDDLPIVRGDRIQLQQVILNLLLNAADAMVEVEERTRTLLVQTRFDGGEKVRLSVRDAGVGVDPQAIEKLFDAFYTTKANGMGVGLSISRSIIENHEGRLWATANDGPGATFSFSIPCAPGPASGANSQNISLILSNSDPEHVARNP